MGKSWGGKCFYAKLRFGARLPRYKINVLAMANLIMKKAVRLVICGDFMLTSSPVFFERRSVMSPDKLVSKGHHCYWD